MNSLSSCLACNEMECTVAYGSIALEWKNYGGYTAILYVSFISCILLWNRWLKCYLMRWVGEWVEDGLRFTVAHVSSSQLGVRFARIVHSNIYRFRAMCLPYDQG